MTVLENLPATVETPAALVDLARVRRNAERAVARLAEHDLAWRPHIKTHKCLEIARIQLASGARGLTVATLREAEVMSRVTDDLLLAYPPVGSATLARLVRLPASVELKVALDSRAALEGLAGAAAEAGRSFGVLVELDVGMGRVGVGSVEAAAALAKRADDAEGVNFRGLLFYPGHIRAAAGEQDEAIEAVSRRLDGVVDALVEWGLEPEIVSGGSTPTFERSGDFRHVTEIRAGTLIFNDRDARSIGAAGWDDCAYTVLATVVSRAVPGQAVIDAGSKALAKEVRAGGVDGYGVVQGRPDVRVTALSEEHGTLDLGDTEWDPPVGERVRIVPNHVCVSVNLQDELIVSEEGRWSRWPLEARGRGPAPR